MRHRRTSLHLGAAPAAVPVLPDGAEAVPASQAAGGAAAAHPPRDGCPPSGAGGAQRAPEASAVRRPMRWLALHLPLLSLESFCAGLPAGQAAARPVALVADHAIQCVNAAAAACGVRPGMKRSTALALASDLLLAQADAQRDAHAMQDVAHTALAFTPAVSGHDAQTLLLELRATLRLFGGMAALVQQLRQALQPLGYQVCLAAAPTALGAALLARWRAQSAPVEGAGQGPAPASPQSTAASGCDGPSTPRAPDWIHGPHAADIAALRCLLDAAPVHLLEPSRDQLDTLRSMGIDTLAHLRQLPREGLSRRFGEALLDALDRALGLQADPRAWILPPDSYEARLELFTRADTTEQVLHGAAVLLERLVAWARARQGRVAGFTLRMLHDSRHRGAAPPPSTLQVQLAEPSLDPAHLQLLLRERLAHAVLAAPTLELQLSCHQVVHTAPPSGDLFPGKASQAEGMTRLLERLRARLGDAQVQQLQPVADARPERASLAVPVHSLPAAGRGQRARRGPGSTRPLALPGAVGAASAADAARGTSRPPGRSKRASPAGLPGSRAGAASASPPAPVSAPTSALSPASAPAPARHLPLHRPTWLLPDPLPLPERQGQPLLDGQPLRLLSGPERIESGWWDGEAVARDYFVAQAADGSLVWVWQGRLPTGPGEVRWFLQGRFG